MTPEHLISIVRETLTTALEIALPFLLVTLIVGLLVALLQHVMHIQELTLTFVPKIVITAILLVVLFPWILKIMGKFTCRLLIDEWEKIVDLCAYVF